MNLLIRWMMIPDLPRVMEIERASFPAWLTWDDEDFRRCFAGRHFGVVACLDNYIIGYLMVRRGRRWPVLVTAAVDPRFRRRRVATAMFRELTQRYGCSNIRAYILDDNLICHLWLRSLGWRAVTVRRQWYDDRDGYEFHWSRQLDLDKCNSQVVH